jgi:hypothetical protein
MTRLGTINDSDNIFDVSLFVLKNPASGAHNIVSSIGAAEQMRQASASYTGADLNIQFKTFAGSQTAAAPLDNTLVTVANNCLHVGAGVTRVGASVAGTDTTQRAINNNNIIFLEKSSLTSPAGSTSIQLGDSGTNDAAAIFGVILLPDGYSTVTVAETSTLVEIYTYQKTVNAVISETVTLTEIVTAEAPRTPWTRNTKQSSTWVNNPKI